MASPHNRRSSLCAGCKALRWVESTAERLLLSCGSHLPSLPACLRRHSEDVGRLLHDPDQQVVDVVLQLANLKLLLADGFLLFEDQLDQLVVGQLRVGEGGIRGLVFLWRGEEEGKGYKSAEEPDV